MDYLQIIDIIDGGDDRPIRGQSDTIQFRENVSLSNIEDVTKGAAEGSRDDENDVNGFLDAYIKKHIRRPPSIPGPVHIPELPRVNPTDDIEPVEENDDIEPADNDDDQEDEGREDDSRDDDIERVGSADPSEDTGLGDLSERLDNIEFVTGSAAKPKRKKSPKPRSASHAVPHRTPKHSVPKHPESKLFDSWDVLNIEEAEREQKEEIENRIDDILTEKTEADIVSHEVSDLLAPKSASTRTLYKDIDDLLQEYKRKIQ